MTTPRDKKDRQPEAPPEPPAFQRRITFGWLEYIGVPLMAAIPLAALSGYLGQRPAEASVAGAAIELRVQYPQVMRYKTSMPFDVAVRNTGAEALSDVAIRIDRAYLARFADARLAPQPDEITGQHYQISLPHLLPGETRHVVATIEAIDRGRHAGAVRVRAGERPELEARLATLVLP